MALVTQKTLQEKEVKNLTFQVLRNGTEIHLHTLSINPEDLTQKETARSEVTQTLEGAYIEDWGAGLIEISIRGTTGYARRVVNGIEMDGFQEFKNLRSNIYRYFLNPDGTSKRNTSDAYELKFFNWEDNEYYQIYPKQFQLNRSKNRPLLYSYDFSFTCVRSLGKRAPVEDSSPYIRPLVSEDEEQLPNRIHQILDASVKSLRGFKEGL